jgi:uncharacterized protein
MSDLRITACDSVIGLPRVPMNNGIRPDVADLRREMGRLRVSTALVRHRACVDNDPYWGNRTLMAEVAGQPDLLPVFALTPDGEGPMFDPAASARAMLASGAHAAWIAPTAHGFSALPWCCGDLYSALAERRVPLLVSYEEVDGDRLDAIGAAFPELRIVLLGIPRLGRNRMLYPLLRRHAEWLVCFDPVFSVHEGYRDLCDTFGAHRWVMGTGYPDMEGGTGIAAIMYAGLDDEELEAVAHGNIERLLAEVHDDL